MKPQGKIGGVATGPYTASTVGLVGEDDDANVGMTILVVKVLPGVDAFGMGRPFDGFGVEGACNSVVAGRMEKPKKAGVVP